MAKNKAGQPSTQSAGACTAAHTASTTSSRLRITAPQDTGVRTVVEGIGDFHRLKLRHISSTTDIQQGDLLVSSGLGERFPVGYPVATVHSISHDPGKPFVDVIANPVAQLDRSRHVLFVFNAKVDTSEEKPTTTNY